MRIGIDLGGTKIETVALDEAGATLLRRRVPTPAGNYTRTLNTVADLVATAEDELGQKSTVGVATPGSISIRSGLIKNSNSTILNGKRLDRDLSDRLERPSAWRMMQIVLLFPRRLTALARRRTWCSASFLAPALAVVSSLGGSSSRAITGLPVSGATIRCRGLTTMNSRAPPVTAESGAASRRSYAARLSLAIMTLAPART